MDSLITAAARALAVGDPLGALNRVALREDAPALALRGIAMAQLGDLARAKILIRRAAQRFGVREAVSRARCIVAEAEIALASRDLGWPAKTLDAARMTLEAHGDPLNAAHAGLLEARRLVLIGRLQEAEHVLAQIRVESLPPALRTTYELVLAGIAMRRVQARTAASSLARAELAARQSGVPPLTAEVQAAAVLLQEPAARLLRRGGERMLRLGDVEALDGAPALIVDACRNLLRSPQTTVSLATRPVLFALARGLAEAWPHDVSRDELVARAFGAKRADESHRARLRVEIGRLRALIGDLAEVNATARGFALEPKASEEVWVLARPVEERHAAVLALLSDGEAWSSSALALALGASQRNVQRALDALAASGKAQAFGQGRARRWTMPPLPGFTTALLLTAPLLAD